MNLLSVMILIFFLGFLYIKIFLHQRLDRLNGYVKKSVGGFGFNPILLLPYFNDIKQEDEPLKKKCNIFWALAVIALIVLVILT